MLQRQYWEIKRVQARPVGSETVFDFCQEVSGQQSEFRFGNAYVIHGIVPEGFYVQ